MDKPMDVLREFPVRKSKKQKQQFRQAVRVYGEHLGYAVTEEKAPFGARNVLFGDPERADYLVTAHYDTCARLPLPNLLTPESLGWYLLYQLLIAVLMLVPVFLIAGFMGWLTENALTGIAALYVCMVAVLWLMMAGPANKSNANDNTSGVVLVLEMMRAIPEELRDKVCFVLFDLEETGLIGSMSYRGKHKKASNRQLVLNADCIGDGDEILVIPNKKLRRKQSGRLTDWKSLCPIVGEKSITVRDRGFCIFPSDQSNFPFGAGIAAFRRSKVFGLYCSRIHTPNDTICEENNVILIRDLLIRIIEKGK